MAQLPTGTVTFVFSDIEGSTNLLKQLGDAAYAEALATHRRLVRETFAAHDGQEMDTQGDAFFYSFTRAREAVAGAVAVQRAHAAEAWPQGVAVRIRLGLHTGEPVVGDDGYTGLDVVRASRIAATASGGQVLLSEATSAIVAKHLPEGVTLKPAGQRQLKDIDEPEEVFELVIPGVAVSVPSAVVTSAAQHAGLAHPAGRPRRHAAVAAGLHPALPLADQSPHRRSRAGQDRRGSTGSRGCGQPTEARRRPAGRGEPFAEPPPSAKARRGSLSDEIKRLQKLRESGALTEEQYQRAVERAIGDDR